MQTSLWQTLCSKPFSRHWKKKKITHVSTNFGGSHYCTKFLWHGFATSLWTNVMMDAHKKKTKNIFYDKMSREINCQKMTNCLVAKCALISVRYTFLTHSHTWEYKALREKKVQQPFKTYMLIMLINDCTHACVMTSVVLCILGNHCLLWFGQVLLTRLAVLVSWVTLLLLCAVY